MELTRRTAIITGSSRGIGRRIAITIAKDGMNVVINYVKDKLGARETLKLVKRSSGAPAIVVKADMARYGEVNAMIQKTVDKFGGIDVLICNAGIYERCTFNQLTPTRWKRTIAINLTGAYYCCKLALPYLYKSTAGRIIFITSQLAFIGSGQGADYAASKAGLLGLMKSLARELASKNITVNAIAPGYIDTAILAGDTPEKRLHRIQSVPLKRLGTPDDIAYVVSFLASEEASYITGITIPVTGGYFML
jgi:3-oxoacyl-[acyl-carrier protein] reductase